MSNLVTHAETELRRAGWDTDSPESYAALLGAVRAFAEGGWSGGSAPYGINILANLLRYRPLGPLTADPSEWYDVSGMGGGGPGPIWQSTRRPDAFSEDGGKTYYLLDDAPLRPDSRWAWLRWKARLGPEPGWHHSSGTPTLPRHRSVAR